MSKNRKEKLITGFMFIGMGIGWLYGQLVPGLLIGLGLGFIVSEFLKTKERQ